MSLCPYCEAELDLKLSLQPVAVDQDFKNGVMQAMESFLEIQADVMPFGGKLAKKFGKIGLNFVNKYFNKIGALPTVILSCNNCNKTISGDLFQTSGFSGGGVGG